MSRHRIRGNGRPALALSSFAADLVSWRDGEPLAVACPECGRLRLVLRGKLAPHFISIEPTRKESGYWCHGGGQAIEVDLTPSQCMQRLAAWRLHYSRTAVDPRRRHGTRVCGVDAPPKLTPVYRLAS